MHPTTLDVTNDLVVVVVDVDVDVGKRFQMKLP
jgi:hypothetical protein